MGIASVKAKFSAENAQTALKKLIRPLHYTGIVCLAGAVIACIASIALTWIIPVINESHVNLNPQDKLIFKDGEKIPTGNFKVVHESNFSVINLAQIGVDTAHESIYFSSMIKCAELLQKSKPGLQPIPLSVGKNDPKKPLSYENVGVHAQFENSLIDIKASGFEFALTGYQFSSKENKLYTFRINQTSTGLDLEILKFDRQTRNFIKHDTDSFKFECVCALFEFQKLSSTDSTSRGFNFEYELRMSSVGGSQCMNKNLQSLTIKISRGLYMITSVISQTKEDSFVFFDDTDQTAICTELADDLKQIVDERK